jgi:hypothetical protein
MTKLLLPPAAAAADALGVAGCTVTPSRWYASSYGVASTGPADDATRGGTMGRGCLSAAAAAASSYAPSASAPLCPTLTPLENEDAPPATDEDEDDEDGSAAAGGGGGGGIECA